MKDLIFGSSGAPVEKPSIAASTVTINEPKILEVSYNRIYFYSEINRNSILTLNRNLHELCSANLTDARIKGVENPIPIKLHINSFGGSIFAGLAGMDEILKSSEYVEVHTIVDGVCASAGTFLSVSGSKRYINRHAFMLIHQLSSVFWGKHEEFKDEMENLEKLMTVIKEVYLSKTKLPENKLEEILKHDLFFRAEECVEFGLADEIL